MYIHVEYMWHLVLCDEVIVYYCSCCYHTFQTRSSLRNRALAYVVVHVAIQWTELMNYKYTFTHNALLHFTFFTTSLCNHPIKSILRQLVRFLTFLFVESGYIRLTIRPKLNSKKHPSDGHWGPHKLESASVVCIQLLRDKLQFPGAIYRQTWM